MNERPFVFLGGTVAGSNWRERFTRELVGFGVPESRIYNPVVPNWTLECQAAEDKAKEEAEHVLFYICATNQPELPVSIYSVAEAIMALYERPKTTVIAFNFDGIEGHALKALQKIYKDLRRLVYGGGSQFQFSGARITCGDDDLAQLFFEKWQERPQ